MMIDFTLYQNHVVLHYNNGTKAQINFDEHSGKPFARKKIGKGSEWIQHPCIALGRDSQGTYWVVHNHYQQGYAFIDRLEHFSQNEQVYAYPIECDNNIHNVIAAALREVIAKQPYSISQNNCQVTVNRACNGTSKSDDWQTVKRVAGMGFLGILGAVVLAAIFK